MMANEDRFVEQFVELHSTYKGEREDVSNIWIGVQKLNTI